LTEITRGGSQIFFLCWVGVWQRNFEAHEKYVWATTSNFSQAQLSTPWWWIAYDPKHVRV